MNKTKAHPQLESGEDEHLLVQVVDLFSGCGGTSYGFCTAPTKQLRFDLRGAVDIDPYANATYRGMLGINPLAMDVQELRKPEVLQQVADTWRLKRDFPLLLIGCAPCQGFSSHRKKDPRADPRNPLLESFAAITAQLEPDVVIMENVPEMLHEKHWEHFDNWRRIMVDAGYRVRVRIYNLAQFGVPQERFRALVIASRHWQHFSMPHPTHTADQFVTVRQAIGYLRPLDAGGADPLDSMHVTSRHRPETVNLIRLIPADGGSRRALPDGFGPRCHRDVDGFRDVYGRLAWDRPAVAITARCRTPSCGRFVHPEQHRGLSVREAALLQGFPADYVFEGPFDDKFKQIGNAVSPIFARAVATHLDQEWFAEHDSSLPDHDDADDVKAPIRKSFSSSIAAIKRRLHQSGPQHRMSAR